jgi:hypothetical protein
MAIGLDQPAKSTNNHSAPGSQIFGSFPSSQSASRLECRRDPDRIDERINAISTFQIKILCQFMEENRKPGWTIIT